MPEKIYLSPEGHRRLRDEWERLYRVERPGLVEEISAAAAQGDRSENAEYIYGKKRLREIDRRLRFLENRLKNSEVVKGERRESHRVFFGAAVDLRRRDGSIQRLRIVGSDEIDTLGDKVSMASPLGRALMGKCLGDEVEVNTPRGKMRYVIAGIEYEDG